MCVTLDLSLFLACSKLLPASTLVLIDFNIILTKLLASVASPVTDHVNGENIYLDLCLTLCSMMRMLSKYVRTYGGHFISHMRTQM